MTAAVATDSAVWTEVASDAQVREQVDAAGPAPFALAVKANIAVRGFRRSAGCRVLDGTVEEADAPVVAALRRHGAVVVGMANMHELALGVTSRNAAYGAVTVPSAPHLAAGGSSGGSAAAVAAGLATLALGTDTGGSVSIPASHCGVVGFRPSTGRWPTAGVVGLSWTRDTPGVFGASVDDVRRADGWVTGSVEEVAPARPRLGIPRSFLDDLHATTAAAFARVVQVLEGSCELVEVDLEPVLERTRVAEPAVVGYEAPRELGVAAGLALDLPRRAAFDALRHGVDSPDVAEFLAHLHDAPVTADEYARAQRDTLDARQLAAELFEAHGLDALVFPTTPAPAPAVDAATEVVHNGRTLSVFELYTRHTGPGTILGAPMVTVPVGAPEQPIGVTVQGRRNDDARTLAVAALLAGVLLPAR